jgi:SAM-dependent methyltransferase
MATKADWQDATGKVWAENIRLTDRAFSGLTQIMLERLANLPGDNILDIGCGGGELSLALAEARPAAKVVGVDVSLDLVEAARPRAAGFANLQFEVSDATLWTKAGFAPDLLVSRHGVMFFDDPVGAFTHFEDISAAGAQLFFSCFRDPSLNVWLSEAARLLNLPPAADPYAPGPFAFAEEDHVRSILAKAGWRNIVFDPVDFAYVTGAGADPVADALQFFTRIGPAARGLNGLDEAEKADALLRLQRWLASQRTGDLIALPAAAWIVTARRHD